MVLLYFIIAAIIIGFVEGKGTEVTREYILSRGYSESEANRYIRENSGFELFRAIVVGVLFPITIPAYYLYKLGLKLSNISLKKDKETKNVKSNL